MANKNSKGLGRGIDAIFKDFESPDLSANNTVEELPLVDIRPIPTNRVKPLIKKA